jgi:hypothetical protein
MYPLRLLTTYICLFYFDSAVLAHGIDAVVDAWNSKTVSSINSLIKASPDNWERKMYRGKLTEFKYYVKQKGSDASIRSKLLKSINVIIPKNIGEFYIVEANQSGESVKIRAFLIYVTRDGLTHVRKFTYNKDQWIWSKLHLDKKVQVRSNLSKYRLRFDLGFNDDDVVISHFVKGRVMDSQYYLYGTLSPSSTLDQILAF